jgi:hypothetical protein
MICQSVQNTFPAASAACAAAAPLDAPSVASVAAILQPCSFVIGPSRVSHAARSALPSAPPCVMGVHPAASAAPLMQERCNAQHSRSNGMMRVKRVGHRQLQRQADHCTPRPRPSARRLGSVTAAAAVLLCLLCIVSVAAMRKEITACSAQWSTAALSVARRNLAATSLPNQGLAIFAGGYAGGVLFCLVDVRCGIVECVFGIGSVGMRRALSSHLRAAAC